MPLHAFDAFDEALAVAKRYRPRGLWEWLWVVTVALLAGSPGIGIPTPTGGGGGVTPEQRAALEQPLPEPAAVLFVVLLVVLAVVWLVFAVLGALFEFPFLRWLRDGDLAAIEELRANWRKALGLAAFRVVLGAVGFALMAGLAVSLVGTDASPVEYLAALSTYALVFGILGFLTGIVGGLTTAFVVPTMVIHDTGVVGGWRRFWSTLAGAPKQFLAYVVGVAVLTQVGGIMIVLGIILALIPVAVVGLVVAIAAPTALAVLVAAVFGGVLVTVVALAVYTLLQVFLRFYALVFLGTVDEDLDFLAERRAVLDGDETASGGGRSAVGE